MKSGVGMMDKQYAGCVRLDPSTVVDGLGRPSLHKVKIFAVALFRAILPWDFELTEVTHGKPIVVELAIYSLYCRNRIPEPPPESSCSR
jgi:hypothetical protein